MEDQHGVTLPVVYYTRRWPAPDKTTKKVAKVFQDEHGRVVIFKDVYPEDPLFKEDRAVGFDVRVTDRIEVHRFLIYIWETRNYAYVDWPPQNPHKCDQGEGEQWRIPLRQFTVQGISAYTQRQLEHWVHQEVSLDVAQG